MDLQREDKLNQLLQALPEGVAAPSSWLVAQGFPRQWVRIYVLGGWLIPLGRGVYARPTAPVNWEGALLGLQRLAGEPFHVGGISALNRQGFAHYLPLGGEPEIHVWGTARVPAWVGAVKLPERLVFHTRQLFDDDARELGITTLQASVRDWTIQVSAPERAMMEALSLIDETAASFTFAAELFGGLSALRPELVTDLLAACRSIKVKRVFLYLADYYQYPWAQRVDRSRLDLGSGKRLVVRGGRFDKTYQITVPESMKHV